VASRAVVVATGVAVSGACEVLGVDVGDSEDEAFWTIFCAPCAIVACRACGW
jgi:putative transposase